MLRNTTDAKPAGSGSTLFFLLCAAAAMSCALSVEALAQGAPMSTVVKRSLAKAASCVVPAPILNLTPAGGVVFPTPVAQDTCASNSSTTQSFTITNSGNAPLLVGGISAAPGSVDFPTLFFPTGCSNQTLAPGGSCTGTLDFCPGFETGAQSGVLRVFSNAFGSPHTLPLSGTVGAGTPTPAFSYTPSFLDFGNVIVGTTAPSQTVTISNIGSAPMTVTSVATAVPFAVSANTCGTVNAGASCTIDVVYTAPSVLAGTDFGTLTINHTAPGGSAQVNLTGQAVALPGLTVVSLVPPISVTAVSLDFNSWEIGTPDVSGTITITNLSPAPFTPGSANLSVAAAGFFSKGVDNCSGLPLAVGASCDIEIIFHTSTSGVGNYTNSLNVVIGTPLFVVPISGAIVPPQPFIAITPISWNYGTLNVGTPSVCKDFEFKNVGANTVTFDVIAPTSGQFNSVGCNPLPLQCSTTGQPLAPGAACNVSYRFVPAGPEGLRVDYFYAHDPAGIYGYFSTAQLTGFAHVPGPRISLDNDVLDFGSHVVNTTAPSQTINVSNVGETTLTIASMSGPTTGAFPVSDGCAPYPRTLAPGTACAVTFAFTPTAIQGYSDFVSFTSDALNLSTIYANLGGVGVAVPTPSVDFFPVSLSFGSIGVGSASAPQSVSFANTGSAPMTIASILHSGDYTISHDCPLAPATMAANSCCTITATFGPTAGGVRTDTILVTDDAVGSPHAIPLTGIGIPPPSVTAAPPSVSFPDQVVNTSSALFQVVFTNTGITNIVLSGLNYTGDFAQVAPPPPPVAAMADGMKRTAKAVAKAARPKASTLPQCAAGPLAVGASCVADVYFTPTALGPRSGLLSLAFTGGTGSPASVPLAGIGISPNAPGISVSTDALDFGGVVINSGASRSVTVTSSGNGPLDVLGVRTLGAFFSATSNCGLGMAPGSSCTVTVTCLPTSLSQSQGDLYIDHSATGGFRNVSLVCTGIPAPVPKIQVSVTGVGFGNQGLGTTSAISEVKVASVGTAPLALGAMTALRPFGYTTDCPVVLQPGLTCTVKLTFTPITGGSQSGILAIASNDPEKPSSVVRLNGTGCRPFSIQGTRRGTGSCSF